jgi:hypothetical protein
MKASIYNRLVARITAGLVGAGLIMGSSFLTAVTSNHLSFSYLGGLAIMIVGMLSIGLAFLMAE